MKSYYFELFSTMLFNFFDFTVYWPTCLISQANEAELNSGTENDASIAASGDSGGLKQCMSACKANGECSYWTWFKANSTCVFRGLLKITGKSAPGMEAVTGEKYCTGEGKFDSF